VKYKLPAIHSPIYTTKQPFIALTGGRSSFKTWDTGIKVVTEIASGVTDRWAVVREIKDAIDASSKQIIADTIDRLKIPGFKITDKDVTHKNGGRIIFKGIKGGSKSEEKTRLRGLEGVKKLWWEEAQSARAESIEDVFPTIIRVPGSQIVCTWNPYTYEDPIWTKLIAKNDPRVLHIHSTYMDGLEFLSDEVIADAEFMKKDNYELYQHIYLGEPINLSDKAIISITQVNEAIQRTVSDEGQIAIGADIARYGADSTVFFKRKGHKVIDFKEYRMQSITETARLLMEFAGRDKKINIKVDDSGVGGGVTDYLYERNYNVIPVNNGSIAKDKNLYPNAICEQWFEFAKLIDKIELPDMSRLKMELTSRYWTLDTKDRRVIEKKEQYKKRGFSSPDYADALMLCFYNVDACVFDEEDTIEFETRGEI
jgi:phage terminase large subunit